MGALPLSVLVYNLAISIFLKLVTSIFFYYSSLKSFGWAGLAADCQARAGQNHVSEAGFQSCYQIKGHETLAEAVCNGDLKLDNDLL